MIIDPHGLREILLEKFLVQNRVKTLYYYSIKQLLSKFLLKQCPVAVDSGGILLLKLSPGGLVKIINCYILQDCPLLKPFAEGYALVLNLIGNLIIH